MSACYRGEPDARSARAGGGTGDHNSTDLNSHIIQRDAAARAKLNADVVLRDFRVALDADKVVLEEFRDSVAELLAEDYRTADVCASICEDEVRELLADVPGIRVRIPLVRSIVRMVHSIPTVRRYMMKFNLVSTAHSMSRAHSVSQ